MRKLKRISDGKCFDCFVYEGRVSWKWNDVRKELKATYWENSEWKTSPLDEFMPAQEGIDY